MKRNLIIVLIFFVLDFIHHLIYDFGYVTITKIFFVYSKRNFEMDYSMTKILEDLTVSLFIYLFFYFSFIHVFKNKLAFGISFYVVFINAILRIFYYF